MDLFRLPPQLPDESIFSRICRYFTMSGMSTSQFLTRVFANERIAIHPYLTADTRAISVHCENESIDIVWNQTLLPLFAFYLPRYAPIICDPSSSSQQLVRACQLAAFKGGDRLKAKYCQMCAADDIQQYGVAYWHCSQQIPGVEACYKHHLWLTSIPLPNRTHLNAGFLPNPKENERVICTPLSEQFSKHAEKTLNLIKFNAISSPMDRLSVLARKGFITDLGRVRRKQLSEDLYGIAQQLFPVSTSHMMPNSFNDYAYWSSIFSGKLNQHPFKHLLLDFYLEFMAESKTILSLATTRSKDISLEQRCCQLLQQDLSMTEVGRRINKSYCFVKAIALRHNISINLRPIKITHQVKFDIIQLARRGFHREEIARRLDVSSGSVEFIISTTDGLVAWRKKCKSESMCRRYKCEILRFVQKHLDATRQQIKLECSGAFFWLYLHHREWLNTHLPKPLKPQHVDRVNWAQRDFILSNEIVTILVGLEKRVSRTELDKMMGDHGWLISKKRKLPKTMMVLQQFGIF